MFNQKTKRLTTFVCTAILLMSQYAVAAYACPMTTVSYTSMKMEESAMPMHCLEIKQEKPSALCKAHCEQPPQSSDIPSVGFSPFVAVSLWIVVQVDPVASQTYRAWERGKQRLAEFSPPLRIQYQVFRI